MNADELRKEFEKKSGLLEVGLDVMYRPDDGRIPYFRDAYVEHLESLVLSQAEQIEKMKSQMEGLQGQVLSYPEDVIALKEKNDLLFEALDDIINKSRVYQLGNIDMGGHKLDDPWMIQTISDLQAKNKDLEGQIEKLNKEFEAYRDAMTFDID